MIGSIVRSKDGDPRFARGEVLRAGRTPGVVIVRWPHETAFAALSDLDAA